jgi:hypothetical protein
MDPGLRQPVLNGFLKGNTISPWAGRAPPPIHETILIGIVKIAQNYT